MLLVGLVLEAGNETLNWKSFGNLWYITNKGITK